jgi:hypothetical protein
MEWSEKVTVNQSEKITRFLWNQNFHYRPWASSWSPTWTTYIHCQFTFSHVIILSSIYSNVIFQYQAWFFKWSHPPGFRMRFTCFVHLIIHSLIILSVFCEGYKLFTPTAGIESRTSLWAWPQQVSLSHCLTGSWGNRQRVADTYSDWNLCKTIRKFNATGHDPESVPPTSHPHNSFT